MLRTARTAGVVGLIVLGGALAAGCGSSDDEAAPASVVTVVETTTASPTPTGVTQPPVTTDIAVPETTEQVNVVGEGVGCGYPGTTAVFADGATAFCARLAGTDGYVWSRTAEVAPNPALAEPDVAAGMPCHGYQTGAFAYDASGTQLVCSEYVWQVNVGQRPHTEWGDGQREWAECIQTQTEDECREQLNG